MKNVKFYPKRIAIVIAMFLAIPLASIIAHVTDIHLPTGEEINMTENVPEGKSERQSWKEQTEYYNDWYENLDETEKEEANSNKNEVEWEISDEVQTNKEKKNR